MPIATKAPKDSPKPAINEWGDVWRTLEGLEGENEQGVEEGSFFCPTYFPPLCISEDQKKIIPIRKGEKRRGEN